MLHCVQVGAIDADPRRAARLSWKELVQHLSLLEADGETEVLGCVGEAFDDVLYGFFCVGEKGAVISKQQ